MKLSRILLIVLIVVPLSAVLAGYATLAKPNCPPLRGSAKAGLLDYVSKRYRLPATAPLAVAEISHVATTCYRKLEFKSQDPTKKFRVALFASPDLRFLSRDLLDAHADPAAGSIQPQREIPNVANGNFPALGPANASVTLAVFSDFECPYCARFAGMMKQVLPAEGRRVRIVFRQFPLPMHPWARAAAEAAQCGFQQRNEFFWNLHDFFFEHQRDLTAENLRQKVLEHTRGIAGMDQGKFQACVDRQAAKAAVDAELAFATAAGIHGTPTVFANGKQTQVAGADQLRSLIRQLAENPQAAIPAADRASATRQPPKHREIAGLANGNFPALGPPTAPVTLAVFSDFQCPYCSKFARMMRQEILPAEGGRIRLVFRYFPLDMHRWACAAAEAAACGYEQKNEFFWNLHDFFFEHQKELTPENLRQRVLDRARTIAGLDTSKFQTCLSQERTKAAIDREVAFRRPKRHRSRAHGFPQRQTGRCRRARAAPHPDPRARPECAVYFGRSASPLNASSVTRLRSNSRACSSYELGTISRSRPEFSAQNGPVGNPFSFRT